MSSEDKPNLAKGGANIETSFRLCSASLRKESVDTLNRYRAALSFVYRLGMQNGKVQANPARLVRQRKEENGRIRFLSPEEEKSLRDAIQKQCPQHEYELDVALNTGMRKSEQYALTWDCVDFERRQLVVPRSKNGEARHIPLNDAVVAALRTAENYKNAAGRGSASRRKVH